MTAARFADWLRGFFDAVGDVALTDAQKKRIQDELAKVVTAAAPAPVVDWSKVFPQPYQPQLPTYPAQPYIEPTWPGLGAPPYIYSTGKTAGEATWNSRHITCGGGIQTACAAAMPPGTIFYDGNVILSNVRNP